MIKIMCIDDDKIAGMIAKITLSRFPELQVEFHADSIGAFEALRSEIKKSKENRVLPHFILLDLNMPIMDGWDFLEAFRNEVAKEEPEIKVLILSSSMDPADEMKAMEYPFVRAFIQKPIQDSILAILEKDL